MIIQKYQKIMSPSIIISPPPGLDNIRMSAYNHNILHIRCPSNALSLKSEGFK